MKKTIPLVALLVGVHILLLGSFSASAAQDRNISEQVTFLYYSDIEEAGRFYESILGFEPTFELYWVKIYKTNQGAAV